MFRSLTLYLLPVAILTLALLALISGAYSLIRHGISGHCGARIYYDAYHGARHLWNRDNRRHRIAYHTVSGYGRFHNALQEEGFEVEVETSRGFDRSTLDRHEVFFIGEQTYHARFMTEEEQRDLIEWVKDGGGLFAVVEHTNAHYMTEVFDQLFRDLPVKARRDSIADLEQSTPLSPTWIDLPIVKQHPVTRGVAEYRFFNGCSLDTENGVLFSSESAWSDRQDAEANPIHNGNKARDPEESAGPLAGVAAFEYGKGRVVVIGDHNAFSNPNLYWGDHYEFGMNSMSWLAGPRLNPHLSRMAAGMVVALVGLYLVRRSRASVRGILVTTVVLTLAAAGGWYLSRPISTDFFVHLGNDSAMKYMTKEPGGYFTLYGQWTKEPQLRPWASRKLEAGHEALFLSAPREEFTAEQLATIDDYLAREKTVVYMASIDSLESEAGVQLQKKFQFQVKIDGDLQLPRGRTPFIARGPDKWLESIFRFYVYSGTPGVTVQGLTPVVHLTRGSFHIADRQWEDEKPLFHVLSEKRAGPGIFMLFAPVEMFNGRSLLHLYEDADVVRQQMAELIIRLGKFASGDESIYYVD